LDFFTRQRAELLNALQKLSRESWSRSALLTGVSPTKQKQTIFDFARRMALHEEAHLTQFI
jgi:hypothetical protein